MKKTILTSMMMAMMAISGQTLAQNTPIEKYPQVPPMFYHTFLDHVQDNAVYSALKDNVQYIGQAGKDNRSYGFGSFADQKGRLIGFFRNGRYEMGISFMPSYALVGTTTDYVAYNLNTGEISYFVKNGVMVNPTTDTSDYAFVSMSYTNGDRYVGETYKKNRHGFGIYYYSTGGFWFGQYDNGVCEGPGCLFRPNNTMRIGYYHQGYEQRMHEVPVK